MESLNKVSRRLSEREMAFVEKKAEKINGIEKIKYKNSLRRSRQIHDRTENIRFNANMIGNGNDADEMKYSVVNGAYLKGLKEHSIVEYNDTAKEINEVRNDNTQINEAMNIPYCNVKQKDSADRYSINGDANMRHSKSRNRKNTEKALRDMTNDAGNGPDEKVRNSEYINCTDAEADENVSELTIKQSENPKRKNKRSKKCKPKTMSLKQFGLDHELTITYIPPLKCSTSQQTFMMDRWKRRVIAKKQSSMSTKSANDESECEKDDNEEEKNGNKVEKVQRNINDGLETDLKDLELTSSALTPIHGNSIEKKGQLDGLSENDPSVESMDKVLEGGNNTETEDETLPGPRSPVYGAFNSSTGMILLNNRDNKKSRLWRINLSRNTNRGSLIDPARHVHNTCPRSISHSTCLSNSLEKFESSIKLDLSFPDRPMSENIGERLHEARISVNPHRHRACAVKTKESLASLDTSGATIKDESSSPKNKWLRIYSKPHERREPARFTKHKPNFREMIKSPAWSSSNRTPIHVNKKTKSM